MKSYTRRILLGMNDKYYMLFSSDLVKPVKDLVKESSKLKTLIFKSAITSTSLDPKAASSFVSYVNGFLEFWEDFAMDMNDKMKDVNIKLPSTSSVLNTDAYEKIKDWFYDSYDYASVLKFTDCIVKGVSEDKFNKEYTIDDLSSEYINKSFGDDKPDNVAGLLDIAVSSNEAININSNLKMFNAIKNRMIITSNDRVELFRSIREVIKFLTDSNLMNRYLNLDSPKIFVSAINNIIDYCVYSLSIYATRIYMINQFVYPVINYQRSSIISESADPVRLADSNKENFDNIQVTIMRDADESVCKNPDNINILFHAFSDCSSAIGADGEYGVRYNSKPSPDRINCYYSLDRFNNNQFFNALTNNDLLNLILCEMNKGTASDHVELMNDLLKSLVYNNLQGIQTSSSSKQEFLAIFRSVKYDRNVKSPTIEGYRKLFADLYVFVHTIIGTLHTTLRQMIDYSKSAFSFQNPDMTSKQTKNAENIRIVSELYSDLVYVMLQKGREIESDYNELNGSNLNKILGIDIPIHTKETTSEITNAIPDTNRVPIDLTDLYSLPAFENMQFYDEAVKYLYGLSDDMYYSEAFNLSEIANKIKALIQGMITKIKNWISNKDRQAALKYASEKGDAITKMNFNNQTMTVLPFKNNGTSETINMNQIVSNMIEGLNGFDLKDIESPDAVTAFIKKAYPNETVYSWFSDKDGAAKFRNWVLYQNDNEVNADKQQGVTINGNEINKRVGWWIETCKSAVTMAQKLQDLGTRLMNAQDQIKNKIANIVEPNQSVQVQDPGPSGDNKNQNNTNEQNNNQNANQNNEKAANCSLLMNEIQLMITRIYLPMNDICMFYVDSEYRYLREAYSKGSANKSSSQNQ